MVEIKVRIKKKIFQSTENGYCIFQTESCDKTKEEIIITGHFADFFKGEILEIKGEIVSHKKYGDQIKVQSYNLCNPSDINGIIKYLSSPRFKGIGKKTALKIVNKFKESAIEIIEKQPEKLLKIKGLSKSVIRELNKVKTDSQILKKLKIKLLPYGIGEGKVFQIFQVFGGKSVDIIQTNPYILINEIEGIGFKRADQIARSMEIERDTSFRITAGIEFVMDELINQSGTICMVKEDLISKAKGVLMVEESLIASKVQDLVISNQLFEITLDASTLICKYKHHLIEEQTALKLKQIVSGENKLTINDKLFLPKDKKEDVQLSDKQVEAIKITAKNKVTIISGGPGTGKTTLIKFLYRTFECAGKSIRIVAPTGRAAKRIQEACGYKAQTIHRLLSINPKNLKFKYNQNNLLEIDVLIVDEFSMVDSFLFFALIRSLPDSTRLVLIGDKDQLASVGPGNVLQDMIESNRFPSIFLTRNFRQRGNSFIIENAFRIKEQKELVIQPYSPDLDFVFLNLMNEAKIMSKIIGILNFYKQEYSYNSLKLQILAPVYRGLVGIDSINQQIQQVCNESEILYNQNNRLIKKNDKVMQIKNNYDKGVFNGELGVVVGLNKKDETISIKFDTNIIQYRFSELDQVVLAYSISIHKAQGSEFDLVVLIIHPSHFRMLNREIFYTAVTRAKFKLILISTKEAVGKSINTSAPNIRRTLLKHYLKVHHKEQKCPD